MFLFFSGGVMVTGAQQRWSSLITHDLIVMQTVEQYTKLKKSQHFIFPSIILPHFYLTTFRFFFFIEFKLPNIQVSLY